VGDPIEAIRLALLTLPTVTSRGLPVSVRLQGPAAQLRVSGTGGEPGLYPGHHEPTVVVDIFGAGAAGTSGQPVDDGTAAAIAFGLVDDIDAITSPIVTAQGEVAALAVAALPGESDDPLTDRPQWVLPLIAVVYT
jgi:hypothetical protein